MRADVIGTALVIFRDGRACVPVYAQKVVQNTRGYDITDEGQARYPGRLALVDVYRVGLGLWKQVGA